MSEITAPQTKMTREGLLKSLHLGRVLKVPTDMPAVLDIAQRMQSAGEIQPYAPRGENAFCLTPSGLAEAVKLYGPVVAEIPMATELDLAIPDMSKSLAGTVKDDQLAEFARALRTRFRYISASDELSDPTSVIHGADTKEPVFVLRGRDMLSGQVVGWWIWLAQNRGVGDDKIERALIQQSALTNWAEKALPQTGRRPEHVQTADEQFALPSSTLKRAHPDEPVFVLRGADVLAAKTVEYWAYLAHLNGSDAVTISGALKIARTMRDWTRKMIPGTVSLKRLAEADVDG
ncbi:MAG: hypothetical protein JWM91_4085 [Rhodospirillales bacterium]|nr:hypothetical protein [Rhodospirillales bacterium]